MYFVGARIPAYLTIVCSSADTTRLGSVPSWHPCIHGIPAKATKSYKVATSEADRIGHVSYDIMVRDDRHGLYFEDDLEERAGADDASHVQIDDDEDESEDAQRHTYHDAQEAQPVPSWPQSYR